MFKFIPNIPVWRLHVLHCVAKALSIRVHVDGVLLGSSHGKYDGATERDDR